MIIKLANSQKRSVVNARRFSHTTHDLQQATTISRRSRAAIIKGRLFSIPQSTTTQILRNYSYFLSTYDYTPQKTKAVILLV